MKYLVTLSLRTPPGTRPRLGSDGSTFLGKELLFEDVRGCTGPKLTCYEGESLPLWRRGRQPLHTHRSYLFLKSPWSSGELFAPSFVPDVSQLKARGVRSSLRRKLQKITEQRPPHFFDRPCFSKPHIRNHTLSGGLSFRGIFSSTVEVLREFRVHGP